jgi:hypothetical protein
MRNISGTKQEYTTTLKLVEHAKPSIELQNFRSMPTSSTSFTTDKQYKPYGHISTASSTKIYHMLKDLSYYL